MARKTRKPSGKAAAGGKTAGDLPIQIIETAMSLAAERGWRRLSLAEIATESGQPLSAVYPLFPSKAAILSAFSRRVDGLVLASLEQEPLEGTAKERLFDVTMRRFDALQPYRAALSRIYAAEACGPVGFVCGTLRLRRTLAGMLEAAGFASDGPLGMLRIEGLGAAYLAALRVWFRDESEDLAATMAALDRALSRLDRLARLMERPARRVAA
ncbi:MAG: TetR family transcriptional regulator [Kiloniellales bacterium]